MLFVVTGFSLSCMCEVLGMQNMPKGINYKQDASSLTLREK